MAEINIISDTKGVQSYTYGWLKYMSKISGMDKEDIELVSVCDINDLPLLRKPKTRKLRIIGGQEAFNDQLCLMYGDAVVVGEGFDFFKDYKRLGSIEKVLEQPYVLTKDKSEVISSTNIDWKLCPVIKTAENKVMVLGGRGCKNKCMFCYASWTTKHQVAPNLNVDFGDKKFRVNVITNDSEGSLTQKVMVRSITVKKYLSLTRTEAANCRFYRFGLESFTEAGRKAFHKPITSEMLRAVAGVAKILGHDIQLFVIMGVEPQESIVEFVEAIGKDVSKKPRIIIKGTYFNPCLHTPLVNYDLRNLYHWDINYIYGKLTEFSGRYRTTMALDMGNGLYRGLVHRARSLEEVELLWHVRQKGSKEITKTVNEAGLSHLWDTPLPTKVRFDWRKNDLKRVENN